jgi:sugar lactone lactonase YvrE
VRTNPLLRLLVGLTTLFGVVAAAAPAGAGPSFPPRINLPNGFRPEGIVIGRGSTFYVGSLANGALFRGDLRTGDGAVIFAGNGTPTVGLAIDNQNRVFAAGGGSGTGKLIDGNTGQLLTTYTFTTAASFVNDVVVTRTDAWFTDSQRPVLYKVPLEGGGPVTVPLSGDYVHVAGLNLNGIEATPNGDALIAVQTATGKLFRIDPGTGVATLIDVGGTAFTNGDGLLLQGHTLSVVRNQNNVVVVVRLSDDVTSGEVVGETHDPGFDVPTTLDRHGSALYLVNARFSTPPTPTTSYWLTQVHA